MMDAEAACTIHDDDQRQMPAVAEFAEKLSRSLRNFALVFGRIAQIERRDRHMARCARNRQRRRRQV